MFNNQVLAGSSGQGGVTQQSLKFNDDESQYLSWTPASAGNLTTWTWSGWVKRCNLSDGALFSANYSSNQIIFSLDRLYFEHYDGSNNNYKISTNKLRDTSAWYHLVFVWDTSNATAADRMRMYINSERVTNFDSSSDPSLNVSSKFNTAIAHEIGHRINPANFYLDAYLAEVNFIDGQALDPTSFGETIDGYWKAKDYSGSYGTNGFRLTFEDDVVSEGFNATTYLATEANQSISGIGFSPDLVIVKNRDSSSNGRWGVIDSVRGVNKTLATDITDAEVTSRSDLLTSFDADGFSLGADAAAYGWNNTTYTAGDRQVAWCWDAGTGSAASNTDGSITSTVKANPDYGFSVVTYTSPNNSSDQTVGHGLSQAPDMIICKNRDTAYNWDIYHSGTGSVEDTLTFTSAATRDFDVFTTTAPTSTVFGTKNSFTHNGTDDYVAYCFHSVAGYSSFGTYSGTDSPGVTVTTGFRPAFIMIKATNLVEGWVIIDGTRDTINPHNKALRANSSTAEVTGNSAFDIDFTDTGFILQGTEDAINGYNGGTGEYIYMAFADTREAAFWKDVSGQGNHWTPNNLDYRDSLIDSPANNFAVMNPLNTATSTLSEGNLKVLTQASGYSPCVATFGQRSGKWYWEHFVQDTSTADFIGVVDDTWDVESGNYVGGLLGSSGVDSISYYADGSKYINGTGTSYGASYTTADFIGVALNLDDDEITFYKNGVSQGVISYTFSGNDILPANGEGTGTSNTATFIVNFGQDSTFSGATTAGGNTDANGIGDFKYAPPAGYLALCTSNLPTPTIVDGSEHFNTVLYTGTGATQSITGVGFQPDFVWAKRRSATGDHILSDSVRTAGKYLSSNLTAAEITSTDFDSFDSDGFTVNAVDQTGGLNASGSTYAAWNWKAGGTAVSNTDGSITSQVSANTDAGFSIVSYTGTGANATVGHGLSSAPEMIITKPRNSADNWISWHTALGATGYIYLNLTNASNTGAAVWNSTLPSSTVFSIGTSSNINTSGQTQVAYCFHSVDGYSKVGSYTGNGSSDGTFVYTGFRPAWVMVKTSSLAGQYWNIFDNVRDPFNDQNTQSLYPNVSDAEGT
jgi:hypothetical protein